MILLGATKDLIIKKNEIVCCLNSLPYLRSRWLRAGFQSSQRLPFANLQNNHTARIPSREGAQYIRTLEKKVLRMDYFFGDEGNTTIIMDEHETFEIDSYLGYYKCYRKQSANAEVTNLFDDWLQDCSYHSESDNGGHMFSCNITKGTRFMYPGQNLITIDANGLYPLHIERVSLRPLIFQ